MLEMMCAGLPPLTHPASGADPHYSTARVARFGHQMASALSRIPHYKALLRPHSLPMLQQPIAFHAAFVWFIGACLQV